MKYALNLDTDGHILSVTYPEYATEDMPIVDEVPDNYIDYKYLDGTIIHDPLPNAPKPTPSEKEENLTWNVLANALREGVNMI